MGAARRRGSLEERKAQAVEAGRAKGVRTTRQKVSNTIGGMGHLLSIELLSALLGSKHNRKRS